MSDWSAAEWAGPAAARDQELLGWLQEQYEAATTHTDHFSCKGPVFDRDGTLAHWGHRPNFFSLDIKTMSKLQQCADKDDEKLPMTLFYFNALHMDDCDETWTVKLGDHVTINEPKTNEAGEEVPDLYVARLDEIVYTVTGKRRITVQWLYRIQDTNLAEPVKVVGGATRRRGTQHADDGGQPLMVLPVGGDDFASQRVWLCGSAEDNRRYCHGYDIDCIIDPVRVFFVPPGCETPEQVKQLHPTFDKGDFFYNGYTKQDFHTFEDMLVDLTPWSPLYRKVWEAHGVAGIHKLRGKLSLGDLDGGFQRLMSLSRGAPDLGRELGMQEALSAPASAEKTPRVLQKLELFAGGGGLSYMAQDMEGCGSIVSCWANDINASACATYACNRPYAFVSCCGLEELLQLCKKHHAATSKWLGAGWKDLSQMLPLLDLPPGKRYSRQHMPEGVGCGGGRNPDDALPFVHSAKKGQEARQQLQAVLLRLAELRSVQEVKQELARRQGSGDSQPITTEMAEFVYQQAQHAKQYKALQQAKEEGLPTPDFEACRAALPRVRLLPANFDSSSGSVEQRAARLLEAVLPRQPSEDHFAAVAAQKQAAPQQKPKAQGGKADKGPAAATAAAGSNAAATYKQAVKVAYEKAWGEQLAALEANLRVHKEQGLGKVVEVRDVRIRDCAVRVKQGSSAKQTEGALTSYECWLEFEVTRSGGSGEAWHWEHEALMHLDEAIPVMQMFLLAMVADKTIPLPGDVDIMTGGPPCQNMSGLNRQARQEDVLNDPKNRLVACYMGTIEHLQPAYLLIEQVTDIYKKEDAKYARFTLVTMLQHGYQTRAGILTAGNYGAPQGRQRAIFWGARSSVEQLPPFPAATHQCKQHGIGNPEGCKFGIVEALPAGSEVGGVTVKPLYPFHVWGDVTSDLPAVDNYSETERQAYRSAPKTLLQQWLRRNPPAHELPVLMRAAHADGAMEVWGPLFHQQDVAKALAGDDARTVMAAGKQAICQTSKWLGSLTVEQGRKLAAAHAKEAARAARAAASVSAEGGEEEEGEEQQGEDACLDEDQEDAAEAAELQTLMGQERDFTRNVQRKHLQLLSAGNSDKAEELVLMAQTQLHAITQFTGVRRLREMRKAQQSDCLLAPLRDQRPHQCNLDDCMRMEALPKGRGVGFRDWEGVVTNADQTCCAGSWHAAAKEDKGETAKVKARVEAYKALPAAEREKTDPMKFVFDGIRLVSGCAGGGNDPKPPPGLLGASGNDTKYRVDSYGTLVKGTCQEGCSSQTFFMATNGLLCPRWCVTYKKGQSIGRNGCFGRIHPDIIQPTVVTRPEPHNLQLVHDEEGRVVTVRENSRCQAFPDFHVFVGLEGGTKYGSGKGVRIVAERYLQIGNAVAPPMAAGLGRCLLLAAAKKAPVAEPVIYSADPEWEAAVELGEAAGCVAYSKANNVPQEAPDNWERHPQATGKGGRKRAAADPAAESAGAQQQPDDLGSAESDADAGGPAEPAPKRQKGGSSKKGQSEVAAAAAAAATSQRKPGSKKVPKQQQPDAQAAAAETGAAAEAGAAGAGDTTHEGQQPAAGKPPKKKKKKRALGAAAAAMDVSPDAGSGDTAPKQQSQKKRKPQQPQSPVAAAAAAVAAMATAAAGDADAGASSQADDAADIAVIDSDQPVHKSPAAGARSGSDGKPRPQRAQAAAATAAIRRSLDKESAPLF